MPSSKAKPAGAFTSALLVEAYENFKNNDTNRTLFKSESGVEFELVLKKIGDVNVPGAAAIKAAKRHARRLGERL